MDNKQKLEELNQKIKELDKRINQVAGDIQINENYEQYELEDEQGKKDKYPDLYDLHQRLAILEQQKEPLIVEQDDLEQLVEQEEQINEGKKLYDDACKKIELLEEQISARKKQVDEAKVQIQNLNKEIYALKQSEEYKNNNEQVMDQVKSLEAEMEFQVFAKNKLVSMLKDMRAEIKVLEQNKIQLVEQYGEKILPPTEKDESEHQEVNKKVEQERKDNQGVTQQQVQYGVPSIGVDGNTGATNSVYSYDSAYNHEEVKDKSVDKPEIDFNMLYKKCRKGTLTDKDFGELAEIMKHPSNYAKYGITSGVVFNKAKIILEAMAKMVADDDTLAKETLEALGVAPIQADEKEQIMSGDKLAKWRGINTLLNEPDKKIDTEERLRKAISMDRETLSEEQKLAWDNANNLLKKYESLRSAIGTYNHEYNESVKKIRRLFFRDKDETTPALPVGDETRNHSSRTDDNVLNGISDLTNDIIDESNIVKKVTLGEQIVTDNREV